MIIDIMIVAVIAFFLACFVYYLTYLIVRRSKFK